MWRILDARTGRWATVAAFSVQARAELQVLAWRERQRRGGRQDLPFEAVQSYRAVRSLPS